MRNSSLRKWEARVFNQSVRDAIENGDVTELSISESWADSHYFVVWAYNEEHAREQLHHKYPKLNGFVITDIIEIKD